MSRYDVSKILDLESPLEAGSEEASKGADDGGEEGHPEGVEEEGVDGQGLLVDQKTRPGAQSLEGQPPLLEGRDKEKISIVRCRPAPGRGEKVHMTWSSAPARWSIQLGRQSMEPIQVENECYPALSQPLFYLTHEVGEPYAHDNSGQPSSNETLPSLLWTQLSKKGLKDFLLGVVFDSYLYERCAAHGKAEHVGHDVVDDDHHDGHDEPDEPLEHVLDDQVALGDHTEQGHMGPGKEGELQEMKKVTIRNS